MAKKQNRIETDLGLYGPLILESIQQRMEVPTRRKYAGVRIDFATWLGREPSPSERVAMSRNISRLEKLGLVSHLQGRRLVLTKAGKLVADKLDGFPAQLTDAELTQIFNTPIDALLLPEPVGGPNPPDPDTSRAGTESSAGSDPGSLPAPGQTGDRHQAE